MEGVATAKKGVAEAAARAEAQYGKHAVFEGKAVETPVPMVESPKLGTDPFSFVDVGDARAIEQGDAVLSIPPTDPGMRHALAQHMGASTPEALIDARDAALDRIAQKLGNAERKAVAHDAFALRLQVILEKEGVVPKRLVGEKGELPTAVEADPMGGFRPAATMPDITQSMPAVWNDPFQLNLVPHIGAGRGPDGKRLPPFNPNGGAGVENCVPCVIAFIQSVQKRELVEASRDYPENLGFISRAKQHIIEQTGVRFGDQQDNVMHTAHARQFFVVSLGRNRTVSGHVLIGIVQNGRPMLYDPRSHVRYLDPETFPRFTAFPILLNNNRRLRR
ncbi:MAG TPA: hypothetical protein PKA58_23630, partial [Polyangium sp.]|nr:hypothetical protein [Polyangium sp.]